MISTDEDPTVFAKAWACESNAGCLFGQGPLDPLGPQMPPPAHVSAKPTFEFR